MTITPRALAALMRQSVSPVILLRRHCWGDWGQLPAADRRANADAVRTHGRVCSRYRLPTGLIIYVITEGAPDRRHTTIVTPDDN